MLGPLYHKCLKWESRFGLRFLGEIEPGGNGLEQIAGATPYLGHVPFQRRIGHQSVDDAETGSNQLDDEIDLAQTFLIGSINVLAPMIAWAMHGVQGKRKSRDVRTPRLSFRA